MINKINLITVFLALLFSGTMLAMEDKHIEYKLRLEEVIQSLEKYNIKFYDYLIKNQIPNILKYDDLYLKQVYNRLGLFSYSDTSIRDLLESVKNENNEVTLDCRLFAGIVEHLLDDRLLPGQQFMLTFSTTKLSPRIAKFLTINNKFHDLSNGLEEIPSPFHGVWLFETASGEYYGLSHVGPTKKSLDEWKDELIQGLTQDARHFPVVKNLLDKHGEIINNKDNWVL